MKINQAALHLFENHANQKMNLIEGQIFIGKIKKLFPNHLAQLEVANIKLTAKLEMPLSAGKSYLFQVENLEELPKLKLLESKEPFGMGSHSNALSKAVLQQLGAVSSTQNIELVRSLLKEGLPISKTLLASISQWLNNKEITSKEVSALKTMVQHQLPLTEQTFRAVLSLSSGESLSSLLTKLSQALEKGESSQSSNANKVRQLLQQVMGLAVNVEEELTANSVQKTDSSHFLTIKKLVNILGVNYENAVRRFSIGTLSFAEFEEELHTLKPLLLNVLKEEPSSSVKVLIEQTIHRITGIQLANYEDSLQTILFQVPFGDQMHNHDAVIQWQGKKKNGKIDPDFCRVLFHLTLKNLKETIVDVQVQNRVLSIQIYTEHKNIEQVVSKFSAVLKEQLSTLNYQLSHIKVLEPVEGKGARNSSVHNKLFQSYKGVDIRI